MRMLRLKVWAKAWQKLIQTMLLLTLLVLSPFSWADLQSIPELKQRVTDLTATLTQSQKASLEAKLAALEESKGSQLAVLIVESTHPEAIEELGQSH